MADVITVCDSSSQCGILPYKDIDEVELCKFAPVLGLLTLSPCSTNLTRVATAIFPMAGDRFGERPLT